jgi:hypothetical protein
VPATRERQRRARSGEKRNEKMKRKK